MNYSKTTPLSQRDLQQVAGGLSFAIITDPGCILYAPGYGPKGPTTQPVIPGLY